MALEDIVCSIESAKRLKELGVKQKSIFYYRASENPLSHVFSESDVPDDSWYVYLGDYKYSQMHDWEMSAFTIEELIRMLPQYITNDEFYNYSLEIRRFKWVPEPVKVVPCWVVNYKCVDYGIRDGDELKPLALPLFCNVFNQNGAEAFAQVLIKLIEEKYLKIEEL